VTCGLLKDVAVQCFNLKSLLLRAVTAIIRFIRVTFLDQECLGTVRSLERRCSIFGNVSA
jgi:hypothetical protein